MILNLDFINYYFLVPLFIIGIITSYTDIKFGKIYNKVIAIGFSYFLILILTFFLYNLPIHLNEESIRYISSVIINGLIAFLVGYLIWNAKLWSAGDAKLFSLYALFLPLYFYSESYIDYFPSINLLVNIFFPFVIVLVVSSIIVTIKGILNKEIKVNPKKMFSLNFLKSFLNGFQKAFFGIAFAFLIINYSFLFFESFLKIEVNLFIIFIVIYLIISPIQSLRSKFPIVGKMIYLSVIGWFSFLILSGNFAELIQTLKVLLVFIILINLTRSVLGFYINTMEIKKIKIKKVERGMIPVKEDLMSFFKKSKNLDLKIFESIDAGGLSEEQAKTIREMFENENLEIKVYKTFPFAPFLLLAGTISVITQSSFLPIANDIFQSII